MKHQNKIIVGVTSVALTGLLMTACAEDTEEPRPAPSGPVETSEDPSPTAQPPVKDDLISLKLDKDSMGDVMAQYEIKNHSTHRVDYMIEFEVLNKSGDRIESLDDSLFWVDNVGAGQTVKGEEFTFLNTTGDKINIIDVVRTRA